MVKCDFFCKLLITELNFPLSMSAHLELTEALVDVVLQLAMVHIAYLMYDITKVKKRKRSQEKLNDLLRQKENIEHYITYNILPCLCSRGRGEHAEIFKLFRLYDEIPVWSQKKGMRFDPYEGCDVDDDDLMDFIDRCLAKQPLLSTEEWRQKVRSLIMCETQERERLLPQLSPGGEVEIAGLYELCEDKFYATDSRIYLLQKLELKLLAEDLPEKQQGLRINQYCVKQATASQEGEQTGFDPS
jgi:hypothetical protein